jgi:hypothetical protein
VGLPEDILHHARIGCGIQHLDLRGLTMPTRSYSYGRLARLIFVMSLFAVCANTQGQDNALPGVIAIWFAWYAFHPDTDVYRAD